MDDLEKFVELIREVYNKCPYLSCMRPKSMFPKLEDEIKELKAAYDSCYNIAIIEELSDILFHIVFVIICAESYKIFTLEDVLEYAFEKYRRRNAHVFSDNPAKTSEEAVASWQEQKRKEKEDAQSK